MPTRNYDYAKNAPNLQFLSRPSTARNTSMGMPRSHLKQTAIYIHLSSDTAPFDQRQLLAEALAKCGIYARENRIPFSKGNVALVDATTGPAGHHHLPKLEKLKRLVESGRIDHVVCVSIEAFGTDPATLTGLFDMFLECGVRLHSVETRQIRLDIIASSPWRAGYADTRLPVQPMTPDQPECAAKACGSHLPEAYRSVLGHPEVVVLSRVAAMRDAGLSIPLITAMLRFERGVGTTRIAEAVFA